MKWKSGSETVERGYKFTYDNLNRLTAATYGERVNIISNLNRHNEVVTYNDRMGNIKTLQRQGKLDSGYGLIDNLTYTYTGNRLAKVTDAVTTPVTCQGAFHFVDGANVPEEYTYDTNGNITRDLNRNITSITYNSLNLPSVITLSGDKSVTYGYDAAGRKLSAVYKSGTTITTSRDYVGNKVYNNGTLSIVLTEEGYTTASGTPAYYYHLKDHQGNNRVVISQGGAVQEVNHYYPFGGLFGEGVQPSIQRYKYNGKELDREFGLDMYDYGARHYDAALGRWFTVDPLAEKYYFISPYVYVANNPVRFIDPDGNDWRDAVKGFLVAVIDNASGFDFRSSAAQDINNAADFNRGQDIGDMASVLFGSAEMIGEAANAAKGVQVAVVGLAAEGPSGGTSTTVVVGGIAQTVQGAAMIAHGSIMAASGSKNLND